MWDQSNFMVQILTSPPDAILCLFLSIAARERAPATHIIALKSVVSFVTAHQPDEHIPLLNENLQGAHLVRGVSPKFGIKCSATKTNWIIATYTCSTVETTCSTLQRGS